MTMLNCTSCCWLVSALFAFPNKGSRRVPRGRGVSAAVYGEQVPAALGCAEGEAVAPAPVGVPRRGRAYPAEGLRIRPGTLTSEEGRV